MEQPHENFGCLPGIFVASGGLILMFGEGTGILDDSKLSNYIYGASSAFFLAALITFASEYIMKNGNDNNS